MVKRFNSCDVALSGLGLEESHDPKGNWVKYDDYKALMKQKEELEGLLRGVTSHASMGSTTGKGMGLNDICVEISRMRNKLYKDVTESTMKKCLGVMSLFREEGKITKDAHDDMVNEIKKKLSVMG